MSLTKKTLVIGASTNPERYSNKAMKMLKSKGHPILAFGLKNGEVEGIEIKTQFPENEDVDTVTMYVGPKHQEELYDEIIQLKPKRVIFNPGTENPEFYDFLNTAKIDYEEACTLVLLSTENY